MVLVTDVPMLEPMMIGMAELTSNTGGERTSQMTGFCPTVILIRPMTCVLTPGSIFQYILGLLG